MDFEQEKLERCSAECLAVNETSSAWNHPALEHCNTAPVHANKDMLVEGHGLIFSRSMTEKGPSKHDLTLDKLSDSEKKKIIVNLVKIQNDGTVEVDVTQSEPVASELLKLDAADVLSTDHTGTIVESNRTVPRLKIAILVVGTRGDVQPFLAIARRLQEFGHYVRLATHANFDTFVKSAGIDFYPLGGDPRVLAGCHAHVAEALGVPLHIFFTMPWTPTREFPHPLARVAHSAGYRLSYLIVDLIIWWGTRKFINDFRKRKLKLAPVAYFSAYHGSISHLPTGYLWSPHLVPKPNDWGVLVDVVGFCFLNLGAKYQPNKQFSQWIQGGSMPIYVGFGSMPLEDSKKTTHIILEALKDTGQRGIIDRGWGDLGIFLEVPDNVFLLEDCPHDWLFPRCAAVVKERAHELAKKIENEDGVAAAVDAFHRHLPQQLPMPAAVTEEDSPDPFRWFFQMMEKWCCLPCI